MQVIATSLVLPNCFFFLQIQGTDFINNPEFIENQSTEEDIGGVRALHSWSRGMFFIFGAGSHIEYWQPLYSYGSCYSWEASVCFVLVVCLDCITACFIQF